MRYPKKSELEEIQKWPFTKIPELFCFIETIWSVTKVKKEVRKTGILYILETKNWEGNLQIIEALKSNKSIWSTIWKHTYINNDSIFFLDYDWISYD